MAQKIRVGVFRGGPGPLYDISLKHGGEILKQLPSKYQGLDILVTKDGLWHLGGIPLSPGELSGRVDIVFNAFSGEHGENGQEQALWRRLGVPYTGSASFATARAFHKPHAKRVFLRHGIKTPRALLAYADDDPGEVFFATHRTISPPWVIKPAGAGFSIGVSLARTQEDFIKALLKVFRLGQVALVEEYIRGKEATCLVVEGFAGKVHTLPPVYVAKSEGAILDHSAKQNDLGHRISLSFSPEEMWMIRNAAKEAHNALGLRHYSRADFILSPSRGLFLLEVNPLPQLHRGSLGYHALSRGDVSLSDFLDHVLLLAARKEKSPHLAAV